MREFKPFTVVHPIQGEARRVETPENPVEVFPILTMSPFGSNAIRDFRPKAVEEPELRDVPLIDEASDEDLDAGDEGPKVVTSSATSSAEPSVGEQDTPPQTLHPSTQSPNPENPASVAKVSSPSSESLETKNDGWPLPPALG